MRKAFYHLLTTDPEWSGLMPGGLHERSALVDSVDSERVMPFALYAFVGSPRPGRALPAVPRVELWCYQDRGNYSIINAALARADALLLPLMQYVFEDERIAEATPQGWSGDLYDDVFRANTRNAAYLLIGSGR